MPFGIKLSVIQGLVQKTKYNPSSKKFIVVFKSIDIAALIALFVGDNAVRKGNTLTIKIDNTMSTKQLISLLGVASAGS